MYIQKKMSVFIRLLLSHVVLTSRMSTANLCFVLISINKVIHFKNEKYRVIYNKNKTDFVLFHTKNTLINSLLNNCILFSFISIYLTTSKIKNIIVSQCHFYFLLRVFVFFGMWSLFPCVFYRFFYSNLNIFL